MSCGNRFQCGLKKATRFSFQPDKPSNPELHNENKQRLNDLLRAREEMDRGFTTAIPNTENTSGAQILPAVTTIASQMEVDAAQGPSQSTPWKIPSALDYEKKNK